MVISVTPGARQFLADKGASALTVTSLVFSSCCSGPLAPEVKPGSPADPVGFMRFEASDVAVYYDSLLEPRPELVVDLKDYGSYRELFVQAWE